MAMKIAQIMEALPLRFPYLMLDRVLKVSPKERKITTLKNVTIGEPFFVGHLPGEPLMPGTLIIEAMAQTVGLLAVLMADGPGKLSGYLVKVGECVFKRKVVPGDQLVIEARVLDVRHGLVKAEATAFVDEERVAGPTTITLALEKGA